jgi:hypothetical protein
MQPSADSRKKKRRRRRRRRLAACCSSRPAAGAAQGQCQCGSSSPGGGGGGSLVARTPRAFSSCSSGAASSACAPAAAAVHLGTQHQQHKLAALLVALALLLVLPRPPLVAGVPVVSPRRMARIRSHVERINKTPVRSIEVRTRQRIICRSWMMRQLCLCFCFSFFLSVSRLTTTHISFVSEPGRRHHRLRGGARAARPGPPAPQGARRPDGAARGAAGRRRALLPGWLCDERQRRRQGQQAGRVADVAPRRALSPGHGGHPADERRGRAARRIHLPLRPQEEAPEGRRRARGLRAGRHHRQWARGELRQCVRTVYLQFSSN